MTNIVPSIQTVDFNPTTNAGYVVFGLTIPTGAPGRTLKGIEVTNGISDADNTPLVIKVWKGAIDDSDSGTDTGCLLATVTWSATQKAWTGVYSAIAPTYSSTWKTWTSNQFDEGDVLTVEIDTATETTTTGYITLFWE